MFLIEYSEGSFISANRIEWIQVKKDTLKFTVESDPEAPFTVSEDYREVFLNNLSAINQNGTIN